MLKGITVTLISKTAKGMDEFRRPVYEETEVEVENVLVGEPSAQEVLDTLNLTGRKAVYILAIPKGDKHIWEGQRVRFFDQEWSVIGIPTKGIDSLIPLKWNMKVQVERYGTG